MLADKSKIFRKTNINTEKNILMDLRSYIKITVIKKKYNKILELMIQDMQYIIFNQQCFNDISTH